MKRQIYLDYAYEVADLIWHDYDARRHRAIEEGKAALRDRGRLQNTFQFVGTVAPAEAMRHITLRNAKISTYVLRTPSTQVESKSLSSRPMLILP
ncbi:MAG: hypothetical protein QGH25_06140 [Candidatus Latescibacteria bacterium]|jgi:hypothetical protein|nr:hypothetical protein [Candidatus Latescibacterota bacterium]